MLQKKICLLQKYKTFILNRAHYGEKAAKIRKELVKSFGLKYKSEIPSLNVIKLNIYIKIILFTTIIFSLSDALFIITKSTRANLKKKQILSNLPQ